MEHIVQFAIGIDDQKIKDIIMGKAEKEIMATLTNDIRRHIFDKNYYGQPDEKFLSYWVKERVDKILSDSKTEIIELAAVHLADKLSRTKAVKEKVNEVLKGENPNA